MSESKLCCVCASKHGDGAEVAGRYKGMGSIPTLYLLQVDHSLPSHFSGLSLIPGPSISVDAMMAITLPQTLLR